MSGYEERKALIQTRDQKAKQEIERNQQALEDFKNETTCRCYEVSIDKRVYSDGEKEFISHEEWFNRPFHPHQSHTECKEELYNFIRNDANDNLDKIQYSPVFKINDVIFSYSDETCKEVANDLIYKDGYHNAEYTYSVIDLGTEEGKSKHVLLKKRPNSNIYCFDVYYLIGSRSNCACC